jgi:DNA-binding response OmpR family regulator
MKTKILIIEDEIIVALDIQAALEELGYEVTDIATNYTGALQSVSENTPDIIPSDINLKNSKDGIDTIKKIHETHTIPAIYLTAFSDDETINRAIETNPLAYLLKPFKQEELKSTLLLALYKSKQPSSQNSENNDNPYKYLGSNYFYNEENKQLFFKEQEIQLTQKESELLDILYKNRGKTVAFETIEYHIWEDTSVSSSTLRTLIYRLRTKLEYKLIETIATQGCRLL